MNQPLVSVVVITYNSSKYVIETLESVKNQTYQNIELIITDDCSADNTVEICKNWLVSNKDRFVKTELITVDKNTGIPANCNRGLYASEGEWIKLIAGDDMLINDCVESNIVYTKSNIDCRILCSLPEILTEPTNTAINESKFKRYLNAIPFFNLNSKKQFSSLIRNSLPICPPTSFFYSDEVISIGGFDTEFFGEDFLLYLRLSKTGFKIHFLNKKTVIYRIHNSASYLYNEGIFQDFWLDQKYKSIKKYSNMTDYLKYPFSYFDYLIVFLAKKITIRFGNNKNVWNYIRLFTLLSPYQVFELLKKLPFCKKNHNSK